MRDAKIELPPSAIDVLVIVQEWGNLPYRAICSCWKSSQENLAPKWYLSKEFYRYVQPFTEVGGDVMYWEYLPEPTEQEIAFIRGRLL
jgi:hypothetical protein